MLIRIEFSFRCYHNYLKSFKNDRIFFQVGPDGAGHFVKMVHNGIEYGDMQLICEAYHLMKDALGMSQEEMAGVRPQLTGI